MNETDREKLSLLLRGALPPAGGADPPADLWPRLLGELDRRPLRWGWIDFVWASLAAAAFAVFPEAVPWALFCL